MSYDCLTIDFAQEVGAKFIVRGIRTVKAVSYTHLDVYKRQDILTNTDKGTHNINIDLNSNC